MTDRRDNDRQRSDPKHEEELHQLLDGELSERERLRVEGELSETDTADLAAFAQVGDMLRAHAQDVAAELPSDALFAQIEARVTEDKRLGRGYMHVVVGGGRRKAVTGIGLALAIAAAAALGIFVRDSRPQPIAEHTPDAGQAVAVLEEPVMGSEVVEVDFGGNAGTVFAVEGSAGQPLAVVWIEDEKPSL